MTAAVISIVPGPSVLFIVSRALSVGRTGAVAAATGNTLGSVFQGVLATFGVGTVIAESQLMYTVLKFCGAIYLVSMGISTLRDRSLAASDSPTDSGICRKSELRKGFMVGATNPKTVVFFAAALPQFVDRDRGYVVLQMLTLLCVYGGLSWVTDTSWGFAGGSMRSWTQQSPRRIELLIGAGGLCIVGLGAWLALSHGGA